MGKIENFQIHLETEDGVIRPGQPIQGYVLLVLSGDLKVRDITLELIGRARVKWEEYYYTGTSYTPIRYESDEPYVKGSKKLVDGSGDTVTLEAKEYQYPFEFDPLSPDVKTSFEGKHGSIRYFLRAVIDLPMKLDRKCKRAFSVIADHDLNGIAGAENEVSNSETKTMRNMAMMKKGELSCTATIPVKGLVPGQPVNLEVSADCNSGDDIASITAKLVQRAEFTGVHRLFGKVVKSKNKHLETVVAEVTSHKADDENSSSRKIHFTDFILPSTPPTLQGSACIKIEYFVTVEVDPSGVHKNLSLQIPIIVGTVPLKQLEAEEAAEGGVRLEAEAPPTYEECSFGRVTINADDSSVEDEPGEESGDKKEQGEEDEPPETTSEYAPLYPVYKFT